MRRYLAYAPQHFAQDAKTAHGVIRYATDPTVAVVDPSCAGKRVRDVVSSLECDAPIVSTIAQALRFEPTALLIGTAPMGGALPQSWRDDVLAAMRGGLDIVSGLHTILGDDPQLASAARASGVAIVDLRKPPDVPLFSGAVYATRPPIVLTVGNDCAVGKMTVSLELVRAASGLGRRAVFVPTGQTGIAIAGWGIAIDRVIADFATGAAEQLVLRAAHDDPDLIVVEGQGGINHPAYAPVTLALLFGCAPDALVLVCNPAKQHVSGFDVPTLGYDELIRTYEGLCATVKPATVVGIALNTSSLDDAAARREIERARTQTALPADDVVRFGPHAFYHAIAPRLAKTVVRRVPGGGSV